MTTISGKPWSPTTIGGKFLPAGSRPPLPNPLAERLDRMAEMCERAARTRHADTAVGAASAARWHGRAGAYRHAARLLRGES